MRRRDLVYLLAVAACAVAFFVDATTLAFRPEAPVEAPRRGAAGEARDVDMRKLERLLREGYLSDHEALYAKPLDEGSVKDAGVDRGEHSDD